jgi:hypothetical protein
LPFPEHGIDKEFAKLRFPGALLQNTPKNSEQSIEICPSKFLRDLCMQLLVMSKIPKRKHKRSDIEANYRNKTKTFWFGPHTIGTKAKHFDLVQNNFYCKQIVSVLAQKFWDKAKQFDLVCLLSEQKQNILIWSKNVLIASKSFPFGPKILVRSKAIWFGLEIVLGKIECGYLYIIIHIENSYMYLS